MQGTFERADLKEFLLSLAKRGAKAVMLVGQGRIGKTASLANEVVAAREEVSHLSYIRKVAEVMQIVRETHIAAGGRVFNKTQFICDDVGIMFSSTN